MSVLLPAATTYISYAGYIPFTEMAIKSSALYAADMYLLAFGWVLGNALLPFFIFAAAIITKPIEAYVHRHFIKLAKQKLSQMPDLTVI
ncbi:MAG: UDP-N-acetylmuramoyl-tripeptide--D-alanyl-D-alanine ligase, partial [Aliifodinibius sp.]|nr:UDP-N-acetylmuramoyl-tripeptide--D-alanyl-D-alanine ligase [Fodinibius sp.]NIV12376.1 UDP-N-acetylmuramoyl-tripeptide--D-alanyl-D-alanine ligase [Fodinibius sp.]NIY24701.1 UDP-N-acetylmuramoyl-tripeptide--D-alanyl-D-alanine ligase [Fodinibius sp.]